MQTCSHSLHFEASLVYVFFNIIVRCAFIRLLSCVDFGSFVSYHYYTLCIYKASLLFRLPFSFITKLLVRAGHFFTLLYVFFIIIVHCAFIRLLSCWVFVLLYHQITCTCRPVHILCILRLLSCMCASTLSYAVHL